MLNKYLSLINYSFLDNMGDERVVHDFIWRDQEKKIFQGMKEEIKYLKDNWREKKAKEAAR